jgi:lysozyme
MDGYKMNHERLFKTLKEDEGIEYKIYADHLGYLTFGIGHLIRKEDPEFGSPLGTPVTEQRVQEAFKKDVDLAVSECVVLYGNKFHLWPDEVKEILVNMMFNMGRTRLTKFAKFKDALEKREWQRAAFEGRDSLWYRQVTNRAERLMKRLEAVK